MSQKATLTDIELKDHGNKLFAARKYEDAISCYSKAIVRIFSSWISLFLLLLVLIIARLFL